MPAPDPDDIQAWHQNGRWTVRGNIWPDGNHKDRNTRMLAILRNLTWGGWRCAWCNAPVPLWRRADARYCCEACRKKSARDRRRWDKP